jgi:hypothetical protein
MSRRFLVLIAALAVPLSLIAGAAVRAASAQGASSASITPSSGPPGSAVSASGMNWQPGDHIQAEWGDDDSDLGSPVVVANDGTFKDSFAIPTDATPGPHQVLFWDEEGRYLEVADFDVTSASTPPPSLCPPKPNPSVDPSKAAGPVGTQFSVTGSGWYPNDTVAVHLPYGSKGIFDVTHATWAADPSGDWQLNVTVGQPTPAGTYQLIFSQSACGGLAVTLDFTVTTPAPPPTPPLPDLLTDTHLPACVLSLTELATDLWIARGAKGALETWHSALALLKATGDLADFYSELRTNHFWAALINAAVIDPLNDCLIGVQILLDDTAGQAGTAVAQWIIQYLHPRKPSHHR